jgi:hypothetical protein
VTSEIPVRRFIPFRRSDVAEICLAHEGLDEDARGRYERARERIESHFRDDFSAIRQRAKSLYAPHDPDADTVDIDLGAGDEPGDIAEILEELLDRANYERVSEEELEAAFRSSSLFSIRLHVDTSDFADMLLFTRGITQREEQVPLVWGLFPRRVTFLNYDRVVLFLRVRDDVDVETTLGGCRPGATMLKLFQNVPNADLEMLFPNTRIGMRTIDKLLIGIPAIVSGGIVLTTKLGTTLVLLGSLFGFWLGLHSEEVELNRATTIALLAGLGTLGAYVWKQFSSFRNRKLAFTQALTHNLYFKLLDNNAGVLLRVLDDAEDSECKESLIAYAFLLAADKPITSQELDGRIEAWFEERWRCRFDFEIDDAMAKLARLGLASGKEGLWSASSI